jgi:hypothetical protein
LSLNIGKFPNAVPGAIVWGLVGLGGQYAYNVADARHTKELVEPKESPEPQMSMFNRVMRSKWSPVRRLTTKEYGVMLREKLLALEADIAITNEEIEKLERLKKSKEDK